MGAATAPVAWAGGSVGARSGEGGSLGHGVQTMSDPNGWLKPGLQVEIAGTDTHAGGGWRLRKVLEAGETTVLVEGRKPADTPLAAPALLLVSPSAPVEALIAAAG